MRRFAGFKIVLLSCSKTRIGMRPPICYVPNVALLAAGQLQITTAGIPARPTHALEVMRTAETEFPAVGGQSNGRSAGLEYANHFH